MNGITLLALLALVVGLPLAFRVGLERGRRDPRNRSELFRAKVMAPANTLAEPQPHDAQPVTPALAQPPIAVADVGAAAVPSPALAAGAPTAALAGEHARITRATAAETFALRRQIAAGDAARWQLDAFAADRHQLQRDVASARTDVARYRELLVELEDNAPPPLLDGPNAPDDLKLIVGVGPVLERMLQKIGIGTYRQIAQWRESDIATFDARLPEFHGRIRRDGWVTQARELHLSKYGERP